MDTDTTNQNNANTAEDVTSFVFHLGRYTELLESTSVEAIQFMRDMIAQVRGYT